MNLIWKFENKFDFKLKRQNFVSLWSVLALILAFGLTSGCAESSSNSSASDSEVVSPPDPVVDPDLPPNLKMVSGIEPASAANVNLVNANGYRLSGAMNTNYTNVKSQTASGYKVYLSVIGQGGTTQ